MKSSIIGRRYAGALFELAAEQKLVEKIERDLTDFVAAYQSSDDLRDALENPKVSAAGRKAILTQILTKMGASALLKNTLCLLSDRGRMRSIPEVLAAFESIVEARTGKVRAEVTSATALPDAYYAELEKALSAATGKTVVVVRKQDPSLIAGVVARVGDRVFDGSLRHRLGELKDELLAR